MENSPFISLRPKPTIVFPSIQKGNFTESSLPLNFTVDYDISKITYCLDGQENVSVSGNTTLTGLSNGQHNVTVYATDTLGNVDASNSLSFNIDATDIQKTKELPILITAVSVIATISAASCVGSLVFQGKRKQKQNQSH